MKKLTLLLSLITGITPVAKAEIVPVYVGFKMVKCGLFDIERCAKTQAVMSQRTYRKLGKPRFAEFAYDKVLPETFNKTADLTPREFGNIDTIINGYLSQSFGRQSGELFTLTKVCLDDSCQDIELNARSSKTGRYAYRTLRFPVPGSADTLPVRVDFRQRVRCYRNQYGIYKCGSTLPQLTIKISSESYKALGAPAQISYTYDQRYNLSKLRVQLVPNSKGNMYFIKTDTARSFDPKKHYSFVLNKLCLRNVGCVAASIKDTSYSGEYIKDTLYFDVP